MTGSRCWSRSGSSLASSSTRSDEADELAGRHLAHYVAVVEDAAREADGPLQREAYDRIDADIANIRAAVERALDTGDPAALRLGAALGQYGFVRNRLGEVARWCIDAAAAVPTAPPALRGRALTQAGFARVVMGSPDRAQALLDESLSLARAADDRDLLVETLLMIADLRLEAGSSATAQPLAREALELTSTDTSGWTRARALVIAAPGGSSTTSATTRPMSGSRRRGRCSSGRATAGRSAACC